MLRSKKESVKAKNSKMWFTTFSLCEKFIFQQSSYCQMHTRRAEIMYRWATPLEGKFRPR